MDFKLLLLLLGLGQLVIVVLYVLWGFLGGLKRELKCTAVLLILLLLGWLIFSDPAMMMGIKIPGAILSLLSDLGVAGETASVWETIVQILQAQVPNGSALFVSGSNTYELAYDVVAGVLRGAGLIVITVVMIDLAAAIRLISHFVQLIVRAVKKAKAKNALPVEAEEVAIDEEPEQVIVLNGLEGADDVVVTTDENELPAPKPITQRIWGGVVGLVKACVVLCILFVPLSGVVSILDETSEETRTLISDLVSGDKQLAEGEESNVVDIVFDFVEDYKSSPLGIGVESTSYFFGDSFSTLLFDSAFFITTDTQKIPLRQELVTFIHAVNALEGNIDYKNLPQENLSAALDELKDSQLLPELMPAVIEFVYETPEVKQALANAKQEAAFLQLRYVDWDKDLETILDAVKVIYTLDIFAEDFNYLKLDVETVRTIVELLSTTEFLPKALPVGVQVALKLEAVQELVKDKNFKPDLSQIDWAKDLDKLVDIYGDFQRYELESLEGLDKDAILEMVFEDEESIDVLKDILSSLVHMDLFTTVVAPAGERVLDGMFLEMNEGQFKSLVGVLPIEELSASQWESDLHALVDLADKFYEIGVFGFDLKNMDLSSEKAIATLKDAIDTTFGTYGDENSEAKNGLNLLREEDALLRIIDWAFKNFDLVALDAELNLNGTSIALPKEGAALKELIDVYAGLVKYEEFDLVNGKIDLVGLLEKDDMGELVVSALEALVKSDIVLNTLPEILSHKITPLVSKYEGAEGVVDSIIKDNSSETIINEVKLLVEAVFGAKDLGLFAVPKEGLKAIDFSKTDEMKAIVNALLDSKLFDSYEARILNVILQIAKVEVALEDLEAIDYDVEQGLINGFIDTIAPVLKDEKFVIFNEDNKIEITPELKSFLLTEKSAQAIIDAVQVLFGDYADPESVGSQLISILLVPVYNTFLADKVPAEFQELIVSLKLDTFSPAEIQNDLSILAYVADQLVEFGVFGILDGKAGSVEFAAEFALGNGENILRALADVNILERRPGEILAFVVNYAVAKYNEGQAQNGKPLFIVDKMYASDFKHVVWGEEVNALVESYKALINFLDANTFDQVVHIERFINEKGYLDPEFLTIENGQAVLDIIEPLVTLQILPPIVKAAESQIYRTVAEKGFNIDPILNVENEELSEDLGTLIGIVRKVVNLGALEYVHSKNISVIDYEIIASMIYDAEGADISDLNILQKHEAKIISELVAFVVSEVNLNSDFTIIPSDLKNADITVDAPYLAEIVVTLGDIVTELGIVSLNDALDFAKTVKVESLLGDRDLIREINVERLCDILTAMSNMTYVEAVSPVIFNGVVNMLSVKHPSVGVLYGTVSGEDLCEDLASLGSLADAINSNDLVYFVLGDDLHEIDEEAFVELFETIFGLNVINNNNLEIVRLAVKLVNKVVNVPGLEFEVQTHLFNEFTEETWAADQHALAEILTEVISIAFNDLGIYNIETAKSFASAGEFKQLEFYTPELVEKLGNVAADVVSLETVGALLPSLFDFLVDAARKAVVNGRALEMDILYILEAYEKGELTNEMLAEDVITLVEMAVIALRAGVLDFVKDANNADLNLDEYAVAVEKLGELNILTLDSAKFTTELVNAVVRVAGYNYKAEVKLFAAITEEGWLEDSAQLAEVLVKANDLLEMLGLSTINEVKAFMNTEASYVENYVDEELIDAVVELAQAALSFNAGEKLITDMVNYALPRVERILDKDPKFVRLDLSFLADTVSQASLNNDMYVLGEIVKEVIELGAFEYKTTKNIKNLDLTHVAHIVDLLGDLQLYTNAREGWYVNAAIVATNVTGKNFNLTYESLEGINFEEDNEQLQEVIIQLAELLKANKHDSLEELLNFARDLGATYQQWGTVENGKAIVDILNGLADVEILMACGASTVDYVVYLALVNDIDIRFLYDIPYGYAELGNDVRVIANILDEAIDFGTIDLVWRRHIAKVDLTHVQNIVKEINKLNVFKYAPAEWVEFVANFVGPKLGMNVTVTAKQFAEVDWAAEETAVVALIAKLQELLDANKLESSKECLDFFRQGAYFSNQYVTEENGEFVAQILDCLAELDVLEQLLPNLVEFGMTKVGANLEGDYTIITSKEFTTLAYMIREVIAFGAVEMYNNILWGEKLFYTEDFDLSHVVNVIKALEELDTLKVDKAGLAQFVFAALGFEAPKEVFAQIDFSAENAKLVEVVELVDKLMKNTHLTNLEIIYRWLDQKGYQSAQYINDDNALIVADIIETISEFQLLVPFAGEALDVVFLDVAQLHFLVGQLEGAQVVEDLAATAEIIRELVAFDTIDLFYYGTTEEFKFDNLRNALELALNLNVLNVQRGHAMALVLNYALASVGAQYEAVDFDGIDWELENETILAIYDKAVELLLEMNIDNTAMLKAYIDQKLYMLAQYTNETTLGYAVEIVDLVADLQELEVVIDELALFAISKAPVNLSFLADGIKSDELTAEELVADVHKFAEIANDYLEFELYDMLYSNEYKAVDTDKFVEIFVKLDELHVLNEFRPEWSVAIVNKLLGSYGSISHNDLTHITEAMWENEIVVLANTIVKGYDYLVAQGYADNGELNRIYHELVDEKKYESKPYLVDLLFNDETGAKNEEAVDAFFAIIAEAAQSEVAGVVLHKALNKVVSALEAKGIDLTELPAMVSIDELQADAYLVAEAASEIVMFGAIELYADRGAIDYSSIDRIQNAVKAMLNTNLANKDSGYLMGGILKNESARVSGYFSTDMKLSDKVAAINAVIEDLAYIAQVQNINTLQEAINIAKNPKSFKLVVNTQLNTALVAAQEVLEVMASDEFFAETILAGSKGWLSSVLDNYAGIADIYKIYDGSTLSEDFASLANVLEALGQLDVYAILSSNEAIPYNRVDVVEAIITEVLGLNYFNENGRTAELVRGVSSYLGVDLSSFENMNLDLEGDASKLVEMYKELLVIFESPEYPFVYVNDYNTKQLAPSFVLSKPFIKAAYAAFKELEATTIYEETNGAVLVVLLPLAKITLPEYYQASNVSNCSITDLLADAQVISEMVEKLRDSQIIDVLRDRSISVDVEVVAADIEFLMDKVFDINMLSNGALKRIAELVLRDMVYGKTYMGIYFPQGAFDLSEVEGSHDAELAKQIMAQVVTVLENSNIDSLGDVKAHMNMAGIKAIAMNEANLEAIATAMELVSEMTFFQENAESLWNNFVLPKLAGTRLEKLAKHYTATNEQFVEDLYLGAQIVRAINGLGIVDVYNGAAIDYDQASEVEALLTLVAQLNYLEINHEAIYNYIARKVEAYGGVMFGYEEFTIIEDLPKFAKVYEAALPILLDGNFPYTTLAQYLDMLRSRTIANKEELVKVVYENRSAALDAYHVIREEGLSKYVMILVLPAVKVALPKYHEALNLAGYTYEDLKADAYIALDIAKRAKASQLLEVLKERGSAVIDFDKAVDDFDYMLNKAFEMKIIGNGSLEELAQITLEKFVYGREIAGIYINDCNLDFSNVDAPADAQVLKDVLLEAVAILNNSGISTLGELKAHMNKAGVVEILANETNLEHVANIMELVAQSTFAQHNATNVWHLFVLPKLESRGLDKYVTYAGATNEQLLEDLVIGAQIVRTLNGLGIVEVYKGADINYDQADEVEALLNLITQLNYLEIDRTTIFNLLASKVSALHYYNAKPQDLELVADLLQLAEVYRAALPILNSPEYPYTTLNQYLDILRTRKFAQGTALVNVVNNNLQVAVNTYSEIVKLDTVKYGVIGAYNLVASKGIAASLVSLADPSALSLTQIQADLATSVIIAQAIADSGVKFGVNSAKQIGILSSSELDYAVAYDIVDALYELNCLEGDFDEIVSFVASKAGLTLSVSGLDKDAEKVLVYALIDLLEDLEAELAIVHLGDLLNYYNDLANTVDLVLGDVDIQSDILDFVGVASTTQLGQELIKVAYATYLKPNLPAEYQDFIDFENAAYTPDLWKNDFANLFNVYNKLEEIHYGEPGFAPTFADVLEVFDALFADDGIYATRTNPEAWMDKLVFANLPTIGLFKADAEAVTDWHAEVEAIRDVLVAIAEVAGMDETVLSFNTKSIYEKNNYKDIAKVLDSIIKSVSMRSLVIAVISDAINVNAAAGAKFDLMTFKSAEFDAQVTSTGYAFNEAFWTAEEIERLSKIVVAINVLLYDGSGNFNPDKLDLASPAVYGDHTVNPFNVDGTVDETKLGAVHLFELMYESNTFSTSSVTTLVANAVESLIGDSSLIGSATSKEDITDLFAALSTLAEVTEGKYDASGITLVYDKLTSAPAEVEGLFAALQDSEVLKGALPFLMNKMVAKAADAASVTEDVAYAALATYDSVLSAAIKAPKSNPDAIYSADPAKLVGLFAHI